MSFIVMYDACVLYPAPLRDLSVSEQARALKNPPQTLSGLLETLRRNGLIRAVAKLQELGAGTY
jgi:DNA-binding IclR family transcriptional regulator